ncbi:MAG: SPOR domain-containing protein [Mariprofundaceae bacterium]|nr:SPOR domain-containing protein [Mariprofundaceae bacterium]
MSTLRPWSAESSERKWAVGIAVVCFIILTSLPFWPEKKHDFEEKKLTNAIMASKQIAAVNIEKKSLPKTTLKPSLAHTKQVSKKTIISVKTHTTAIQTTQKNTPPISSQAYFIQVGAFQDKKYAAKLQNKLIKKHWPVIILKKKRLYAVQVGPYKNKLKANNIKKQLAHKEKIKGFITHHAYP